MTHVYLCVTITPVKVEVKISTNGFFACKIQVEHLGYMEKSTAGEVGQAGGTSYTACCVQLQELAQTSSRVQCIYRKISFLGGD
jgi:hypothetical protein